MINEKNGRRRGSSCLLRLAIENKETRRGWARGAPPAAKQSHEMIGIPQSEVLRAGSRAISGVDDLEFTLNLMGQVFAAMWQANSPIAISARKTGRSLP